MVTPVITFTHHVKQEGVCIIVQSLVVQKQFGEEAEILGVNSIFPSVNLEEGDRILAINLVPRGILEDALSEVSL